MATSATQRATQKKPTRQRTYAAVPPVALPARGTAPSSGATGEWERWLAQFRPEARALMNLMVDINCRLAREASMRQPAAQQA